MKKVLKFLLIAIGLFVVGSFIIGMIVGLAGG
jgi:hypothetical protein